MIYNVTLFLASLFLSICSFIIPKKRNYCLFLPGQTRNEFSGNLKYVFQYIHQTHTVLAPMWATKSYDVFLHLTQRSLPVTHYSLCPFWEIIRAEYIFIDGMCGVISRGRFNVIQLWHGTGFKNILALSHRVQNKRSYRVKRLKKHLALYRLVVATSEEDRDRKKKSFLTQHVYITGSPRNDVFFDNRFSRAKYKDVLGISGFERVILYAPTYRQDMPFHPFSAMFWVSINDWAISTNNLLLIKRHRNDGELAVPDDKSHIRDCTESVEDVQELLAVTDVLISDYSSIVTDFVLTGRPVIFYFCDFQEYKRYSRAFYYDLRSILPGPFAYSEAELLELIANTSWFADCSYQERYSAFVNMFHRFKDGQSSRRVLDKVLEINT